MERPLECLGEDQAMKLGPLLEKYIIQNGGAVLLLTDRPERTGLPAHRVAAFRDGAVVEKTEPDSGHDR